MGRRSWSPAGMATGHRVDAAGSGTGPYRHARQLRTCCRRSLEIGMTRRSRCTKYSRSRRKRANLFRTSLAFFSNGLLCLPWWQIVLATLLLTHATIISVSVYPSPLSGASRARAASGRQPWFPLLAVADDGYGDRSLGGSTPQASREVRDR